MKGLNALALLNIVANRFTKSTNQKIEKMCIVNTTLDSSKNAFVLYFLNTSVIEI